MYEVDVSIRTAGVNFKDPLPPPPPFVELFRYLIISLYPMPLFSLSLLRHSVGYGIQNVGIIINLKLKYFRILV